MKLLSEQGHIPWKAESFNYFSGKRSDAWGVFDILAIRSEGMGILGVQVTTRAHMSTRRKKIQRWHGFNQWKLTGNLILLLGWYKKKNRWDVKQEWM